MHQRRLEVFGRIISNLPIWNLKVVVINVKIESKKFFLDKQTNKWDQMTTLEEPVALLQRDDFTFIDWAKQRISFFRAKLETAAQYQDREARIYVGNELISLIKII